MSPASTHLSPKQTEIYTDYLIVPTRVIYISSTHLRQPSKPENTEIRFTHYGGSMTFNGVRVDCFDQSLPPFKDGTELVVFLKRHEGSEIYDLVDAVGALGVDGGRVRPLIRELKLDAVDGVTVSDLATRVLAARSR